MYTRIDIAALLHVKFIDAAISEVYTYTGCLGNHAAIEKVQILRENINKKYIIKFSSLSRKSSLKIC